MKWGRAQSALGDLPHLSKEGLGLGSCFFGHRSRLGVCRYVPKDLNTENKENKEKRKAYFILYHCCGSTSGSEVNIRWVAKYGMYGGWWRGAFDKRFRCA